MNFYDSTYEELHDPRMFGHWWLVQDPQEVLGKLGPEPLSVEFSAKNLVKRLASHRRQLKPLLLDQTFLAGLGNIYTDETLWEARFHPRRLSHTLSHAEQARLYRAIRKVLRQGIRFRGTSLAGETTPAAMPPGRTRFGQPTAAGNPVWTKIVHGLAGHATHFCPRCSVGCSRMNQCPRASVLAGGMPIVLEGGAKRRVARPTLAGE